ncbi:hemin importer ATP-binding subunit [Burkholderia pseudomallei]|nr:hemin importer ATP-binding subunit [Burkholderia pseudomallei]CAJ8450153.1 hemin importer ATP-binding subunit [Burkholderia pseudomallei]CAJ8842805.1 hemin importer ATP-binding subunit [Burkholderia pseudomallei]
MGAYTIEIENCNSIERAEIKISEGALNIKYGPNGLGKSTIARAIIAAAANNGSLQNLKPFKYRSMAGKHEPVVRGTESVGSVLVFDDSYVSQFVFQREEVLKNSFDIFIKTDTFKAAMLEIESLFAGIKSAFDGNEALSSAISDLKEVRDAFGVTKSGALSKASKGYKAFGSGNKIENIPLQLKPFEAFIKSEQPASWIAWQAKGNAFLDLSDNCPYCASDLKEPEKKDTVKQVAKEYDSKAIEHLNALQTIINRLGKYFEQSCRENLEKITKSKIELSPEEINFLGALRGDVETLIVKLEGLRSISFFALRDVDKIEDEIAKLKIDLGLLAKLNSEDTKAVVDPINEKLQELISRVGELKGKINKHKSQIEKSIVENQKSINGFLKSAGYKYSVVIKPEADSYKMKLVHQDFNEHLESAAQHLSYGEKNAFALVLFMHQVLSEKPGLAVLDDPVSSFDKTKKFAILNELFRGKASLRNTTVLMLTHDIEPAIDVIRSVKRLFQHPKPTAYFLASKGGVVVETEIKECDIQTFSQICTENVNNQSDEVIKCIYLRRNFEILNDLGAEYNYLANLLHARAVPIRKTDAGDVAMTAEEVGIAVAGIKEFIPDFDYNAVLAIINDKSEMKRRFQEANIGYDKLQLFRIYKEVHQPADDGDDILQKFVNESFHIENEYVMQLNPHKFDNIPEYVVQECDRVISAN